MADETKAKKTAPVTFKDKHYRQRKVKLDKGALQVSNGQLTTDNADHIKALDEHADFERVE
jgi:hypothetical protein